MTEPADREGLFTDDAVEEFGIGTRAEHLAWCKMRALQYVDQGDMHNAFASFVSDLNKHSGTYHHIVQELGIILLMNGHLETDRQMRDWIEGTR